MAVISIKGMSCEHCVATVSKILSAVANVENVQIDLDKNEASFSENGPVDLDIIKKDLEKNGYELEGN